MHTYNKQQKPFRREWWIHFYLFSWQKRFANIAFIAICLIGTFASQPSNEIFIIFLQGDFYWIFYVCRYFIQHCFICRPSDSTLSENAGIEPRTVATSAFTVRRSSYSATSKFSSFITTHQGIRLLEPLCLLHSQLFEERRDGLLRHLQALLHPLHQVHVILGTIPETGILRRTVPKIQDA